MKIHYYVNRLLRSVWSYYLLYDVQMCRRYSAGDVGAVQPANRRSFIPAEDAIAAKLLSREPPPVTRRPMKMLSVDPAPPLTIEAIPSFRFVCIIIASIDCNNTADMQNIVHF